MDRDEWMSGARWVGGSRGSKHLVGAYLGSTRNQSKLKRRRVSRLSAPQGAEWISPQHVPHNQIHVLDGHAEFEGRSSDKPDLEPGPRFWSSTAGLRNCVFRRFVEIPGSCLLTLAIVSFRHDPLASS